MVVACLVDVGVGAMDGISVSLFYIRAISSKKCDVPLENFSAFEKVIGGVCLLKYIFLQ